MNIKKFIKRKSRRELLEALYVARQAIWELTHAKENPNWFSSENGRRAHISLWTNRGRKAVKSVRHDLKCVDASCASKYD